MINFFYSPCCYKQLITVSKNYLQCKSCKKKYENNNYPDLRKKFKLYKSDKKIHEWYKKEAHVYDKNLPILFKTFYESEKKSRNFMISKLENIKNKTGLEIGCGTGRDTELLLKKIGSKGKLYAFDFSKEMLDIAKKKKKLKKANIFAADGHYIPFKNNSFDFIFSFGGLNTFGNLKKFFSELNRVSKNGARVVIGDESMPPWLKGSLFSKILINTNHHYKYEIPLSLLPTNIKNVSLDWFIGNVFYLISFNIDKKNKYPKSNFNIKIPGERGGTLKSRYYKKF
jgi:ubiquinone/menaquinone biosynthesis C-methylase UbiE